MDPDLSPVPDGEASPRGNMNDMDVNSEPCDLHALQQQQHHGVQVHGGAACAAAAQEGACASYVQTGLTCVASGGAGVCFPAMSSSHVNIPPPCPYSVNYEIPPPKADFSAPPPYEVATKLPTYDEVQREKSREGELGLPSPMHPQVPGPRPSALPMFLAIDADSHPDDSNNAMLGTDFMFFTAFVVSFLFNWIGFLLLMCFCHTIAARYGALSGFGLSLSKWTLIVKHSTDITDHVWLWWLIMSFGLLICIRAIIQYLNIKRGWRLLSGNPHAQERLLFFY